MLKKFLYIMIFSLCCYDVSLSAAQTPPCKDLVSTCLKNWKAEKWKPEGFVRVCSSILTNQQLKEWKDVLQICTTKARKAYESHQAKAAFCNGLVLELDELAEKTYHNKYCVRSEQ